MHQRHWMGIAVMLGSILVMCLTGCDDEDGGEKTSSSLTINIVGWQRDFVEWVILHTADGSELIEVQPIPEDKVVYFNDLPSQRVTATIVSVYRNQSGDPLETSLNTLSNVSTGSWTWGASEYDAVLGWADITFNYPEGDYSTVGAVLTPPFGEQKNIPGGHTPDSPTQHREVYPVYALEPGGTISIVGGARSSGNTGPDYYGLLKGQIFVEGDTNHYELTLASLAVTADIGTNRPCLSATTRMFLDRADGSYMTLNGYEFDVSYTVNARYLPELPWEWMRLEIYGFEDNYHYHLLEYFDQMPESVVLPPTTFSLTYNETANRLESVQATGDADALISMWYIDGNFDMYWQLYQNPLVSIHELPSLSDSVRALIGLTSDPFNPRHVTLFDFDNASGYADVTSKLLSEERDELLSYNRWYYIGYDLEDGASATSVDRTPCLPWQAKRSAQ